MGKSIRSKSKLRAKTVKRNGEFQKFVDGRNDRIAAKLAEKTKKQDDEKRAKKAEEGEDIEEVKEDKEMQVDGENKKKISTSGWRESRTQIYKQRKIKGKKSKTMKF